MVITVSAENSADPILPSRRWDWVCTVGFISIHGVALIGGYYSFSWSGLLLVGLFHYLFGGIGIVVCFHRLLSHHSFRVPKGLEYLMALLGTLAFQRGPIFWVGNHRMHHAHCDTHQDPYNAKEGFWHSHMFWLFRCQPQHRYYEQYSKYAPELDRDPIHRFLDRRHVFLQVILGFILYFLGGWSWVIYGTFVRIVVTWHTTWAVNSIAHTWGGRPYDIPDSSCNNALVALMTYGEGWHNNHHSNPKCAKAGLKWWQLDVSWWFIWILEKLGLAHAVYVRDRIRKD